MASDNALSGTEQPRVPPRTRRFSLAAKTALATLGLGVIAALAFLTVLGPALERDFVSRGDELVDASADGMQAVATAVADQSLAVLADVIEHTANARRRVLHDLPLSLYADDLEGLRAAILAEDDKRTARTLSSLELLAREMRRRLDSGIHTEVARLSADQVARAAEFGSGFRRGAVGTLICLSILMAAGYAFGVERLVGRPLRHLRRATRAVAAGDLSVSVPIRSLDELGILAADFHVMIEQLRASRSEIERQHAALAKGARDLETEVARKTAHLEAALVDLGRTQRQLLHADRLAAVGTLAGGVAHEFNNVIGGIHGCVNEALRDEQDDRRREPLEVIRRAAARGGEITRKLLQFAGTQQTDATSQVVAGLVEEVLDLVEPQTSQSGIHLVRELDCTAAAMVDASALHQVLLNLLTNAIHAMRTSTRRELRVRVDAPADRVRVIVSDTGHGIEADHLDRIFDPFFTSKGMGLDGGAGGTGLGLSVSYGIVESMGGSISVQSTPGSGSEFVVDLPRTDGHTDAPSL